WKVAFLSIEWVAFRVLVGGKLEVTEADDTLAKSTQFQVGGVKSVLHLVVQNLLLAIDKNGSASFEDSLRRAFHAQQIAIVTVFVNSHVVLVGRVEWNFAHLGVLSAKVN